ncbi:formylglycine-generating enzyme family protein [Limnofasciculus baicalensis]|uniref:Formylglycine-generating enzyme family protein n=1 Tax=Limnofasciculus baicalensis BBK-W-15 TaxID=2699891 RepID=A0AAE3GTT2_9CYAN|nr:formylglycine-generating enzyme family protein [Limnofasciculus baicalensis]MCP2730369.1 formylglycine-generating enzyme family protein [Limnofasciculus baicalensis BBK-W-15]
MTNTTDSAQLPELREQAQQTVDRFVRRFDESYRLLAYHAALPLVLTPELVNYLRNEFLRGEKVPWVAEVDLLLSDLCSPVGYELYAMDTHVRGYLLEEMAKNPRFGKRRMAEVARVLINYVSYLGRLNPGVRQEELEAQRWAAMVYLGDEKCKEVVREIANKLLEISSGNSGENRSESEIRAELARLIRITEELSPQLQEEPSLLEYARLMERILRTPAAVNPSELLPTYLVDDVELNFPTRVLRELLQRKVLFSQETVTQVEGYPPLQTFDFEVATIEFDTETTQTEINPQFDLNPFQFKVATIELKQTGWLRRKTKLIINYHQQEALSFTEELDNEIQLEMVAIPGGSFMMGSPENELERRNSESPQHRVTIKPFFMGKYSVTQAQWQAVAFLPQVNRELNSDPSYFKGADRPVESVSWYDAVEFCSRLSIKTGQPYRLPSEAEWEYACRAGTTTPFHFGETITTKLANYNGNYTYGKGFKGEYRQETTPVGSFGVANEFGLYDMHGNVWEWCGDEWHDNYEGAPIDGSVWGENNENDHHSRLLRGGSCCEYPGFCRSVFRGNYIPSDRDLNTLGFRLVCGVAWTL